MEKRPWGYFETLHQSETYKVKKIFLNPNKSFSLQYHEKRW
ncbi:MAG: mannose-6-phosphate isomerase, partial [Candidatus Fonsibacter ubiquis]